MGIFVRRRRATRHALRNAVGWTAEQLERRVLLSAVAWTGAGDRANWTDPDNWSGHAVPGQADDVTINVAAGTSIHIPDQNSEFVHSLVSNAKLSVDGNLSLGTTAQLSGDLLLTGGLFGGVFNFTGGARIVMGTGFFTATVGGTINGDIDATTVDADFFANGLTLNGTMFLGNASGTTASRLAFRQANTLAGSGSIVFGSSTANEIQNQAQGPDGTVTIGPNLTIRGKNGSIDDFDNAHFPGERLVNQGTISADTAGGAIAIPSFMTNQGTIRSTVGTVLTMGSADNQIGARISADGGTITQSGQLNNEGLAQAVNGGTLNLHNLINAAGATVDAEASSLTLSGSISNLGTITATESTVVLAGDFSQADLGNFVRSGGTVKVTGTVHGDITLDASTGAWEVDGATLDGGTIHESPKGVISFGSAGTTLIDRTFDGDIDLESPDSHVFVIGTLTVNGTVTLGDPAGNTSGQIIFGPGAQQFANAQALGTERGGFQEVSHVYLGDASLLGKATIVMGGRAGFGNLILNNTLIKRGPPGTGVPPTFTLPGDNGTPLYVGGGHLTIGPDVVIRGGRGSINNSFSEGTIDNDGTIVSDGANSAVFLGGTGFVGVQANVLNNNRLIQATNGGQVSMDGLVNTASIMANAGVLAFTGLLHNQGTITATNSLVDLKAAPFTQAQLGNFVNSGSTIQLSGLITDGLTLDATTGSWILHDGTVSGGTLTETDGSHLLISSGTLNGATVNGDLELDQIAGATLQILNSLVLNGTMFVGNLPGTVLAEVFTGGRSAPDTTITGTGSIVFGARGSVSNQSGFGAAPAVLTLGPGITVRGSSATIFNAGAGDQIINQGTVDADTAGGTFSLGNTGSVVNQGTMRASNGGTLGVFNLNNAAGHTVSADKGSTLTFKGAWSNDGTISADNATVNLGGTFTRARLGAFVRSGGTVNLTGVLSGGLLLDASTGSWILSGGTLQGGRLDERDGADLILSAGTLANLTVNGDLDAATFNANQTTILGGLTLNGTLRLGNAAGTVSGAVVFGQNNTPAGTLGGNALVALGGGSNFVQNGSALSGPDGTLTLAPSVTIRGKSGVLLNSTTSGAIENQGRIIADTSGGTIRLVGTFVTEGVLQANGGTLQPGNLALAGNGIIQSDLAGTFVFNGSITGDGTASANSRLRGAATLGQPNSSSNPQLIEAMSADRGDTAAGFSRNFVLGTVTVANNNAKLVDQFDNAPGIGPEAVYADALVVPSFATLDLNGLHLYARAAQIDGAVVNGTVSLLPDGGMLTLDTPVQGKISPAGDTDDWTFFGRAGQVITVFVNPATVPPPGAISPGLALTSAQLLDSSGAVLASGDAAGSNLPVSVTNITLPADGTYTVRVSARSDRPDLTGNYVVAAYDVSQQTFPLSLGETVHGSLRTPFSVQHWTFAAAAGDQVQFHLVNETSSALVYTLSGPNGFVGFSHLTGDSTLINLPSDGTYTLTVEGQSGATGDYAFAVLPSTRVSVPLNGSANSTLAGTGQARLFTIDVPSPQALEVRLQDASPADTDELYLRYGAAPTRETYDLRSSSSGPSQSVLVPSAAAGTWYVLVYAAHVPVASPITISDLTSGLHVTAAAPASVGNAAMVTLDINGAGFSPSTSVVLIDSGGAAHQPLATNAVSYTELTATFPAGLAPGTYSLKVTDSLRSETLSAAVTVTPGGAAHLQTSIDPPSALGRHTAATVYLHYANAGTVAMPAPLLVVEGAPQLEPTTGQTVTQLPLLTLDASKAGQNLGVASVPDGYSTSISVLASGRVPGMLLPGESVTVPVYYAGILQPWDFNLTTVALGVGVAKADDPTPFDFSQFKKPLQPPGVDDAIWDGIFAKILSGLGSTVGQLVTAFDTAASTLGSAGEQERDPARLFDFLYLQASDSLGPDLVPSSAVDTSLPLPGGRTLAFARSYHLPLPARDAAGILGNGWAAPYQSSLSFDASGSIQLNSGIGGLVLTFLPNTKNGYDSPDPSVTLAKNADGSFTLTEKGGSQQTFDATGRLIAEQDLIGNRTTLGYDASGRLSTISDSGRSLLLEYNAAGRLRRLTDSDGRVYTYGYDPSNQHLTSVTGPGGTTGYAYDPASNGLSLITYPDGTHRSFAYDPQGRLARTAADGGVGAVHFSYDSLGEITTTDALSHSFHTFYGSVGLPLKSVDPLGNARYATYDDFGQMLTFTDSAGGTSTFAYDALGNPTTVTDPLRGVTRFTYDNFSRLRSFTDANGNETDYNYSGPVLDSVSYANGTEESYHFDPQGNPLSFLNRNGQTTGYTYTGGLLTREDFADGTHYDYTYDGDDNLLTASDATGTTRFTYDTADRMTGVTYPSGKSLMFAYDAGGRRTRMTDQDGYAIHYEYTAAGELERLTDTDNNTIVSYSYDATGRLMRQDNANGTFTTYDYDPAGQLLHLVNHAPGGGVNSRFDYAYDNRGLETSLTTLDGSWAYSYDAEGQLTHAVFTSINPSVPGQDLAYTYDPAGNRLTSVANGTTTAYTPNSVNEYTSVGGVQYRYDADGNLLFDGSNTYTYDPLDRLTNVTNAQGISQYTYNALGQRVTQSVNGAMTQYVTDPVGLGNVVGTYDGAGASTAHFNYGLSLVNEVTPAGTSYFYDFDATGSTQGLSDSTGSYVNRYTYQPFGESSSASGSIANPFQYAGAFGVQTDGNGLTFMRARYYNSRIGRFISSDPIQLLGGDTNFYRYSDNQPTQFIDPSGLNSEQLTPGQVQAYANLVRADVHVLIANFNLDAERAADAREEQLTLQTELALVELDISVVGFGHGVSNSLAITAGAIIGPGPATAILDKVTGRNTTQDYIDVEVELDRLYKVRENYAARLLKFSPLAGTIFDYSSVALPSSFDPNDKLGPAGSGTSHFVSGNNPFPYRVDFENDPSATAPAQQVIVTDQFSPNLDWSTFRLTEIGWGSVLIPVPAGLQHFQTTVSMTENGKTFDVQVEAGIDLATGVVSARFDSIDPITSLPPDVLTGFLPPEDGTGRGQGHFSYFIASKAGLPTGTAIRNIASVSFDGAPIITTNQVNDEDPAKGTDPAKEALVTIDAGAPTSTVSAMPPNQPSPSFTVSWSGQDDAGGSGIATYDVFVSDNGGPFTPFLTATPQTSATFTGVPGHAYGFYTVATDNVGNVQPTPTAAQATTKVSGATIPGDANGDGRVNFSDLLILAQNYGKSNATLAQGDFNGDDKVNFSDLLILAQNYGRTAATVVTAAARRGRRSR